MDWDCVFSWSNSWFVIGTAIPLLSNREGGSCTQVDRPETQETGASEDAPRTAAMKKLHARKHAVLLGGVEGSGFQPVKADR